MERTFFDVKLKQAENTLCSDSNKQPTNINDLNFKDLIYILFEIKKNSPKRTFVGIYSSLEIAREAAIIRKSTINAPDFEICVCDNCRWIEL